jgi:predicted GNAT superfamily acetyltransferase
MRYNFNGTIGEIDNLPGCSQVAVFHSVFVPPDRRSCGFGGAAHALRLEHAKGLGYDAAICTVNMDNKAQLAILEKNHWGNALQFKSKKTGNIVGLFVREI